MSDDVRVVWKQSFNYYNSFLVEEKNSNIYVYTKKLEYANLNNMFEKRFRSIICVL